MSVNEQCEQIARQPRFKAAGAHRPGGPHVADTRGGEQRRVDVGSVHQAGVLAPRHRRRDQIVSRRVHERTHARAAW